MTKLCIINILGRKQKLKRRSKLGLKTRSKLDDRRCLGFLAEVTSDCKYAGFVEGSAWLVRVQPVDSGKMLKKMKQFSKEMPKSKVSNYIKGTTPRSHWSAVIKHQSTWNKRGHGIQVFDTTFTTFRKITTLKCIITTSLRSRTPCNIWL